MKKIILITLFCLNLLQFSVSISHAQTSWRAAGTIDGKPVEIDSNGNVRVTGSINGNTFQLNNNGVNVSGSNGSYFNYGNGNTVNGGTSQVNGTGVLSLIGLAQAIVSRLVPLSVGLAVLAFFWFLINFLWKGASDPKVHADAMKGMGYSLIALFVMVSIWGIIAFFGSMLSIGQGGAITDIKMPKAR